VTLSVTVLKTAMTIISENDKISFENLTQGECTA